MGRMGIIIIIPTVANIILCENTEVGEQTKLFMLCVILGKVYHTGGLFDSDPHLYHVHFLCVCRQQVPSREGSIWRQEQILNGLSGSTLLHSSLTWL